MEKEEIGSDAKDDEIYEKVALALEEKCRQRRAHNFYAKLRKSPIFCQKLIETANQERSKNLSFAKIEMDLGHMQTMALDFFNILDPELCESVWRVLEDTENTILHVKKPSERGGINAVGVLEKEILNKKNGLRSIKKKIEISLEPRNDVRGLVTVAHELAHTMEERVQKKMRPKIDAFGEIFPLFIEKVYADYLVKIGKIDQKEREKLQICDKDTLICDARTLTEEFEILQQLPSPIRAKDLKAFEEKYAGTPRRMKLLKRIKTMIYGLDGHEHYGERQFRYVIGEIVSAELYKRYQKEPKKTMEKLKKFAQNNAHISAQKGFEMLLGENFENDWGIHFGSHKI